MINQLISYLRVSSSRDHRIYIYILFQSMRYLVQFSGGGEWLRVYDLRVDLQVFERPRVQRDSTQDVGQLQKSTLVSVQRKKQLDFSHLTLHLINLIHFFFFKLKHQYVRGICVCVCENQDGSETSSNRKKKKKKKCLNFLETPMTQTGLRRERRERREIGVLSLFLRVDQKTWGEKSPNEKKKREARMTTSRLASDIYSTVGSQKACFSH